MHKIGGTLGEEQTRRNSSGEKGETRGEERIDGKFGRIKEEERVCEGSCTTQRRIQEETSYWKERVEERV